MPEEVLGGGVAVQDAVLGPLPRREVSAEAKAGRGGPWVNAALPMGMRSGLPGREGADLLVVDDEVEGDACPAGPVRVGRASAIANEVALVLWSDWPWWTVRWCVELRVVGAGARCQT